MQKNTTMSKQIIKLTDEKFQNIYTDKKLRNQVASAGGCYTVFPELKFKHYATVSYPIQYIVTKEQIEAAKAEWKRDSDEILKENKNHLLFKTMGMRRGIKGEIDNHRIRVEFVNSKGNEYFIEICPSHYKWLGDIHVTHSIDRTLQKEMGDRVDCQKHFYNAFGLERPGETGLPYKYTEESILKMVNEVFDCKFKKIIIDHYTKFPSDYQSISPKT